MTQIGFFEDFDFNLLDKPDFKEDSVREELIQPLLYNLGYSASGLNTIIRSKTLQHPFVYIGSQERKVNLVPDYLLSVSNKPTWVLDAKAPNENIKVGKNVEQVYSYAIHPEIRTQILTLCNGREFIAFQIDVKEPLIYFHLSEIEKYWQKLYTLLSPNAFTLSGTPSSIQPDTSDFDYNKLIPPIEIKDLKKQSAKRHFGVHPYFTRQVWNVVQEYIKNFTQPGDHVLDPFGGTGVTALESMILGRTTTHIDINPLSIFLVKNLARPVNMNKLATEYTKIVNTYEKNIPTSNKQIELALAKYPYPTGIKLPKGADVDTIEQLFSDAQLSQLAFLKYLICQINDEGIRGTLLLMFSGLLNKINLTYHASAKRTKGQGDSGIMRYYRYRMAPEPVELDVLHYFKSRYKKVIAAKNEIAPFITNETIENMNVMKGTATDLSALDRNSVDYIYTDPPYGKKIQYLDLSVMWNAWLDLPVTEEDYQQEAIEGGKLEKSQEEYSDLLSESIKEMHRVLKFDRWMSFVFAHTDPAYWHIIVDTAEKTGFEYMGAVSQSNNKTSFKKRQNPYTVLSGQLIINFKKTKTPRSIMKMNLGENVTSLILETIEGVIAQNHGATLEEINDELIIKGIEFGFLDILSKKYSDISPLLEQNFDYEKDTKKYQIQQNSKFKSRIDINLRLRYFLQSYLIRMRQQDSDPTFDEIIFHIMPLLKNGITPEEQTILDTLELIAQRTPDNRWRLRDSTGQLRLF